MLFVTRFTFLCSPTNHFGRDWLPAGGTDFAPTVRTMTSAGQAEFAAIIAEVTGLGAGLAGLYFTVGLVVTIAQSHAAAIAGQTWRLADLKEQLIPIVLCFAVAGTASQLSAQLGSILSGAPSSPGEALKVWQALASFVVNTIIFSTGASLAVGIATGAFAAQLAVFVGRPDAVSSAWMRLVMVTLTAALTMTSVSLAQGVLQVVF
jgi:hypothetical protein